MSDHFVYVPFVYPNHNSKKNILISLTKLFFLRKKDLAKAIPFYFYLYHHEDDESYLLKVDASFNN